MAELSTAMPRAGGDYFHISRTFGSIIGIIFGFLSWFALSKNDTPELAPGSFIIIEQKGKSKN